MMPVAESRFPQHVWKAIEDEETNNRMLDIFRNALNQTNSFPRKDEIHEPIFTSY